MKILVFKILMAVIGCLSCAILVNNHFEQLEAMERKINNLESSILYMDSMYLLHIYEIEKEIDVLHLRIDSLDKNILLISEEDKSFFGIKPIWEW